MAKVFLMESGSFDPNQQVKNPVHKVVAGLERIAEAYRVLLWEKAKTLGLSPIQIQILIFLSFHEESLRNVSHLAQEFNVTKPTISDAIRVLKKKDLISTISSTTDKRAYSIHLTEAGKGMVKETNDFANPLFDIIQKWSKPDVRKFSDMLYQLIWSLNQNGVLTVQRMCQNCRFHEMRTDKHYCKWLEVVLHVDQLRIDCPEFQSEQ